jgi:hypothetical protein
MRMETRHGSREVQVVTLKHRSAVAPKPAHHGKDAPIDMFDLIERVVRIRDMAHTIDRRRGDPEQHAIDKNELVRAVGRLEADLRRRGVR